MLIKPQMAHGLGRSDPASPDWAYPIISTAAHHTSTFPIIISRSITRLQIHTVMVLHAWRYMIMRVFTIIII